MARMLWLCVFFILAGHVEGQDTAFNPNPRASLFPISFPSPTTAKALPTCTSGGRVLNSVVIASIVISICFLAEMVGVAYLVFHRPKIRKQNRYKEGTLTSAEQFQPYKPRSNRGSFQSQKFTMLPKAHFEQWISTAPPWISNEIQSPIDVTVLQPSPDSPLLHTQFPGTPVTVPGTPIPSSNIFGSHDRQTWVAGSDLNRRTVLRVPYPWQYPQSARPESSAISMSAVQGNTEGSSDAEQDHEEIPLEQLVATLKARIHELEKQTRVDFKSEMQRQPEVVLRDTSWCPSSLASYKIH
ncbi:hypothetical protein DFH09DRAFT_1162011 [Mycena vulgaris]|nr:hypothetical protein DFH09DRAFT_1162011 [Mycena vulgaris]